MSVLIFSVSMVSAELRSDNIALLTVSCPTFDTESIHDLQQRHSDR